MSVDSLIKKFGQVTESYWFYNGEVELRYAPKEHIYYLMTGEEMVPQDGVTTVCHIIDKSEALIPWAVKMMAIKLLAEAPTMTLPTGERIVRQMPYQEYENLVLAGKTAHKDKLEDAGEVGHIAHDWIERYIKAVIASGSSSIQVQELLATFPADERARNACFAALGWMRDHNVRWLGTERKIYSRRYKYAGTMDGLCLVDSCTNPKCRVCTTLPEPFKDRLTISDWKTSNYLYNEYLLQTAAYMQAYIEETNEPVQDRWVIRLGKEDGEFDPWHAGVETFAEDFEAFRLALMLKRQYEGIKERVRRKEQATRETIKAERRAEKEAAELAEKERKTIEKAEKKAAQEAALKLKCKAADKYKGSRRPTCGCSMCDAKYAEVQARKSSNTEKKIQEKNENVSDNICTEPIVDTCRLLGCGYPICTAPVIEAI